MLISAKQLLGDEMLRAGIFIGVDKTGDLPQLHDAAGGARRMWQWALGQGMKESHAKLITDTDINPVTPDHIYDAVKEILDGPKVDQLIIYFAGHGVNIARNEHWLLTEAPRKTSAAVNVSGTVELARYSGFNHVVFVSDACRVAPEGLQAQNVRGVDVFPNDSSSDKARAVDQFFACYLGNTAAEMKDPGGAAASYSALYTNALLDALCGVRRELFRDTSADGKLRYLMTRTLQTYLENEVPVRVLQRGLQFKVNQNPDAIITSDGTWIASQPKDDENNNQLQVVTRSWRPKGPTITIHAGSEVVSSRTDSIGSANAVILGKGLLRAIAKGSTREINELLRNSLNFGDPAEKMLANSVLQLAEPFGQEHFDSGCGIKIRGARIIDVFMDGYDARRIGDNNVAIGGLRTRRAASVILKFDTNLGAVIPAIQGYIAGLTFKNGELVDVAYEPSANDWRWDVFKARAGMVRTLRAVAASYSLRGRFRLEPNDDLDIAINAQNTKSIDPTLFLYTAYAYHDVQCLDRIHTMSKKLRTDIGFTFFDLALLGRALGKGLLRQDQQIIPFCPLLSQGWSLLRANRVSLPACLNNIELNMKDSLWSLFDSDGLEKLKEAMRRKEVL